MREYIQAVVVCLMSVALGASALHAVEGAGGYRGTGVVLPHYTNTNNVRTFFRFINAFDRRENVFNDETPDGVDLDQSSIFVHITYLRRVAGGSFDDLCDEQDFFFFMTKNDYKLLDVRSDPEAGAPGGFQEGYALAWAVQNVGIGGFFEGQPGEKIYNNHLAADEVTVDLVNGRAWGTNATGFRAQAEEDDEDCTPTDTSDCGPQPDPDIAGDWFDERSDGEEYAILGLINAGDPASGRSGGDGDGYPQYENIRYPERFFATVMSSRVNISGARSSGSRYLVIPISYIQDTDLNGDGDIGDGNCGFGAGGSGANDPEECQERSVWVPSTLPTSMAYVNRYVFDVRAFRHDESRISAPNQTAICYRDYTAAEMTAGVTDSSSFRGPFPDLEEWQGWLDLEGRGFGQLPLLARSTSFDYYNRALVVQVDNVNFGRNVQWGFYPAHDRTTAEYDPDPTDSNAHGAGGAAAIEPNVSSQYD